MGSHQSERCCYERRRRLLVAAQGCHNPGLRQREIIVTLKALAKLPYNYATLSGFVVHWLLNPRVDAGSTLGLSLATAFGVIFLKPHRSAFYSSIRAAISFSTFAQTTPVIWSGSIRGLNSTDRKSTRLNSSHVALS